MKAKTMHKKMILWKVLTPIIALCFLAAAPPLAAQDSGGQSGYKGKEQQHQQRRSADFSEKELEKFADAKSKVDQIRKEYSEELKQVEDQKKASQLQDKYSRQMVQSIKEEGLTIREYNNISSAAQSDPELREKINQMAN
ncbi:MAG: DUF4168 domain-containing protein [Desulfobacterales bacterium]|nr:DUF4168 domain-containing protein [Desulfobacterales bacterium]